MSTKHWGYWVPTGTYAVKMYAFCGMSYVIAEGLDRAAAVRTIARLAVRRRRSGHIVSHGIGKDGLPSYEFGEPENAMLVPDTAGTCSVVPEVQPAFECFECSSLVPIGEQCSCLEDCYDEEADEEDEDEENPYPPQRRHTEGRRAYELTLTADEYRSADFMSARGYLGEITERCSDTEWSEDETEVTLSFTEPAAWDVADVCRSDEHAVWSLTTPSTSLGRKFQKFLDSIV